MHIIIMQVLYISTHRTILVSTFSRVDDALVRHELFSRWRILSPICATRPL